MHSEQQFEPAGKQKVQLDLHLCQAENQAKRWIHLSGQNFFKVQHTALLLELVYFFWFEERQLARGAKMLAKVKLVIHSLACLFRQHSILHTASPTSQATCPSLLHIGILAQTMTSEPCLLRKDNLACFRHSRYLLTWASRRHSGGTATQSWQCRLPLLAPTS